MAGESDLPSLYHPDNPIGRMDPGFEATITLARTNEATLLESAVADFAASSGLHCTPDAEGPGHYAISDQADEEAGGGSVLRRTGGGRPCASKEVNFMT